MNNLKRKLSNNFIYSNVKRKKIPTDKLNHEEKDVYTENYKMC